MRARHRADRLRVLFASAECTPIAQSGGLGEVAAKLPRALRSAGHDARVVMPWYGAIDVKRHGIVLERRFRMDYEGERVWAHVGRATVGGVPIYLVGHPRRQTQEMYGGKSDRYGWVEEHLRFRFFCAATAVAFSTSDWRPDVLHVNDYHSALVPHFMGDARPPTVISIHNARFQGSFGEWIVPQRKRDRDEGPLPPLSSPRARFVNFLRRGVRAADIVVPVSPTYATELSRKSSIDGLSDLLERDRVIGILNGIDTDQLDPRRDRTLAKRYDASSLEDRAINKRHLQEKLGLEVSDRTPLLAMVARLDPQKGIDLVLYSIVQLAERGVQIAITGNGGPKMRELLEEMASAAPGVLVYRPFVREDESLFYAGADIVLVPSRYEPCGLVQMKALRYGAVPIVQRVGGLADSVINHAPPRRGTGFVFGVDKPAHLLAAIDRALEVYARPAQWRALQRRGMAVDVGWERPAARYVAAYRRAKQRRSTTAETIVMRNRREV